MRRCPDFSLKDIHRRPRALDDYKDKKAIVVVFLDTECPLSNLYVPTLIDLHKKYSDKGVQFLAINSSNQDTFIRVSAHAQEREVPFPVLKDFDQKAADGFGAKRTPEVFLLDSGRVIRYHGRIDDQYGIGYRKREADAKRPHGSHRRTTRGQGHHDSEDRGIGLRHRARQARSAER